MSVTRPTLPASTPEDLAADFAALWPRLSERQRQAVAVILIAAQYSTPAELLAAGRMLEHGIPAGLPASLTTEERMILAAFRELGDRLSS